MANIILLVGRLGDVPKTGSFGSDKVYANMSLAVKRDYKNLNGDYDTDWFDVVCFGGLANLCKQYLQKGSKILVQGRLQNDNYVKDGVTIYKNKIVAEKIEFCDSKKDESKPATEVSHDTDNRPAEVRPTSQEDARDEDPFNVGIRNSYPTNMEGAHEGDEPEEKYDPLMALFGL